MESLIDTYSNTNSLRHTLDDAFKAPEFMPVVIYGLVADALCLVPIILYARLKNDTHNYN